MKYLFAFLFALLCTIGILPVLVTATLEAQIAYSALLQASTARQITFAAIFAATILSAFAVVVIVINKRKQAAPVKYERQNIEQQLNELPQRIVEAVQQCDNYLRIPTERVLDLNEPMVIENPLPPGYGRYIPTNLMITQHLQGATRCLSDARAAFLVNNMFEATAQINNARTSLQAALQGKELRDAETTAKELTLQALQAVQK